MTTVQCLFIFVLLLVSLYTRRSFSEHALFLSVLAEIMFSYSSRKHREISKRKNVINMVLHIDNSVIIAHSVLPEPSDSVKH